MYVLEGKEKNRQERHADARLTRLRSNAASGGLRSLSGGGRAVAGSCADLPPPSQSSTLEMGRLETRVPPPPPAALAGARVGESERDEEPDVEPGRRFFRGRRCVTGFHVSTRHMWLCPNWSCAQEAIARLKRAVEQRLLVHSFTCCTLLYCTAH